MAEILLEISKIQVLNQFWLSLFLLIPLVLVARTLVAGTVYSAILLVVVFGLGLGYVLVASDVASPGLPEFKIIELVSRSTIIALIAAFFVGGQELRKIFNKKIVAPDTFMIPSDKEIVVGTTSAQLFYLIRTFFLLLGIEAIFRFTVGIDAGSMSSYYTLLAFIGLTASIILIDHRATFENRKLYVRKGILETFVIILILVASFYIAQIVAPLIALPQIFFAMVITATLGAVFYKWTFGSTIRALLFAGLPIVLAGNFMVGGSRIMEAFNVSEMNAVLAFGFFGQLLWMFGGIALIMTFAKMANVRCLAPGLAGGLSHAGLTGACTAGDLGKKAASRTPIMINLPFIAHIFVFSVLAVSAAQGNLTLIPAIAVLVVGVGLTAWSLRTLRRADGEDSKEITGLMQFSLGWQLTAMFGGFVLLSAFKMPLDYAAAAVTSSLSHFGLFAATQDGMFGAEIASLLPFIFAMPFLVHPFVFFIFGRAMQNKGEMPKIPVYALSAIGLVGVIAALFLI
ncbi:MAG: hypothetical protein FWE46_00815 [Coriobacteriia bacterium]|nr:hypothetical protein [Coriobacteriia bacterium]MCL2537164.1 hypothetical protein [Coriobacteriia bacterium]